MWSSVRIFEPFWCEINWDRSVSISVSIRYLIDRRRGERSFSLHLHIFHLLDRRRFQNLNDVHNLKSIDIAFPIPSEERGNEKFYVLVFQSLQNANLAQRSLTSGDREKGWNLFNRHIRQGLSVKRRTEAKEMNQRATSRLDLHDHSIGSRC